MKTQQEIQDLHDKSGKFGSPNIGQDLANKAAFELHYDIKEIFIDVLGVDNVQSVGNTKDNAVQLRLKVNIASVEQAKLIASLLC